MTIGSGIPSGDGDGGDADIMEFDGAQFIVNSAGKSLCLDSDHKSVVSRPFVNNRNHQWFLQTQQNGTVVILSARSGKIVNAQNSAGQVVLVCTSSPFNWAISRDGKGYRLALPASENLGLSLGDSGVLRPLSEHQATRLYILENNQENEAAIKSGRIDPTTNSATSTSINVTINDLAGSSDTLKQLQDFFKIEGRKNLAIYLGNHQLMGSSMIGSPTPRPPMANPFASRNSTGFPRGLFLIRSVSCPGMYLTVYPGPSLSYQGYDGLPIKAGHGHIGGANIHWIHKQIFFVNSSDELCCDSGHVDVINNLLVISRERPPTAPWPNPWSHPSPTFSYSLDTKMIAVRIQFDPVLSFHWPRPEKEWKDKEFFLVHKLQASAKYPVLTDISRWAHTGSIPWFNGDTNVSAGDETGVGLVEKGELAKIEDKKRMQWEIEER